MNAKSINEVVSEKIKSAGPQPVVDAVVALLVQKENDRRVKALAEALEAAAKAQQELFKVKPDNVTFNEDGSPASSTYSKAKLDEKKKLQEKLAKIEKAIENATNTEKPDFSGLYNIAKGGNDSSGNTEKGDGASQ